MMPRKEATVESGRMPLASRVEVDAGLVRHNVALVRSKLPMGCQLLAVLKADAYGHGAKLVQKIIHQHVDGFLVQTLEEAASLSPTDLTVTVLRAIDLELVQPSVEPIEWAVTNGITLSIERASSVPFLAMVARRVGVKARVQVMIDTGLSRCGVDPVELDAIRSAFRNQSAVVLESLASHLAKGDSPGDPFVVEQIRRFRALTDEMVIASEFRIRRNLAATAGAMLWPASHFDSVRVGGGILGIDPLRRPSSERALRPVLRWTAPLQSIRTIARGDGVGYGQTFVADRPMRIGLVPVGYFDGYPRTASNKGCMIVHGQPCPVVGRLSMDSAMIDLTAVPQTMPGDAVTLIDPNAHSPASVYALAAASDTIPYEITCRIGPRVDRISPVD